MEKVKDSKYKISLKNILRMLIIPISVGLVFTIGCASKTGVTKSSQVNPPPAEKTVTPTPPPPAPTPEETVEKPAPSEETVSGTEAKKPPQTEELPDIGSVFFAFDKYDLSENARAELAKNAQWLKRNPNLKVRVEGNCDERGTVEYNLALGEKRANAVKDYYVSLGIPAGRIETISYGKERPLDPRHNEKAWAENRRADTVKITR